MMSNRIPTTIDEVLAALETRWQIQKAPKNTVAATRADINTIADIISRQLGRPPTVEELDGDTMAKAFAEFADGRAASTIRRCRSSWNGVFEHLVRIGAIAGSPMAAVPAPRTPRRNPKPIQGWEGDSVSRLLSVARAGSRPGRKVWPELDETLITTLLATGLRSSELRSLNLGSIVGPVGQRVVHVVGKGDKERSIPVPDMFDAVIDRWLDSRQQKYPTWRPGTADPLFVQTPTATTPPEVIAAGGDRISEHQVRYIVEGIFAFAGIPPADGALIHQFRHTYGTRIVAGGADVTAVAELMGHNSIVTTQGYLAAAGRATRNAAAINPIWDEIAGARNR